jgi:hypothetical protein
MREFGENIDTSEIKGEEWFRKDPDTSSFPSLAKVEERARVARARLRDLAQRFLDNDGRIVVVTHGGFAHFLVQDFSGLGVWPNAGFRSFQFANPYGDGDEAVLMETWESCERYADVVPINWELMNCEERVLQKSYAVDRLRRHEAHARVVFAAAETGATASPAVIALEDAV